MKLPTITKDNSYFLLLEQQSDAACQAAKSFHGIAVDYDRLSEHAEKIDEIEHHADDICHTLSRKIDSSFITPMDKEDLHLLSTSLDDVTDSIEVIAETLMIYRLPGLRDDIEPLAHLLLESIEVTTEVVAHLRDLRNRDELRPLVIKVNQLENQGDDAYRCAIRNLFHSPTRDPFLFIAWKEIYDRIEMAIDHCERVANMVEGMAAKYA